MMHRSTTGSRGMEKQGKGQAEPARIARARTRKWEWLGLVPHLQVEGLAFPSKASLLREARNRGYAGCKQVFYQRVDSGPLTWAALLAPANPAYSVGGQRGGAANRARVLSESEEMAALCAELDRRKAVIEARQVAAELEDEA